MNQTTFPLFRDLSPEEIESLGGERMELAKEHRLIHRGEHGNELYCLEKGELLVYLDGERGRQELARLHSPAIVGEMEFLTDKPRSATVETATPVTIFSLSFDRIRAKLEHGDAASIKLMLNISKLLAHRLSITLDQLDQVEAQSPRVDLHEFREKLFSDWSL